MVDLPIAQSDLTPLAMTPSVVCTVNWVEGVDEISANTVMDEDLISALIDCVPWANHRFRLLLSHICY